MALFIRDEQVDRLANEVQTVLKLPPRRRPCALPCRTSWHGRGESSRWMNFLLSSRLGQRPWVPGILIST